MGAQQARNLMLDLGKRMNEERREHVPYGES
jgi:hypothetical protein